MFTKTNFSAAKERKNDSNFTWDSHFNHFNFRIMVSCLNLTLNRDPHTYQIELQLHDISYLRFSRAPPFSPKTPGLLYNWLFNCICPSQSFLSKQRNKTQILFTILSLRCWLHYDLLVSHFLRSCLEQTLFWKWFCFKKKLEQRQTRFLLDPHAIFPRWISH